ncbi:alpha-hydroxy-acid oxidizing protein, partial [Nocardia pseudobrasiliensis]|uniref:alpha-hydroxy-acid oxidizing protein n=1 Tax=Nocardia pseudobrasiliensis TaxID=45979 RepID=UPI000A933E69
HIETITAGADVPVIVKEVGFGLSGKTVAWLRELGVAVADVGGRGGTDFARIENARRAGPDYSYLIPWGLSTPCCLLDTADVDGIDILASGGIRSPLDIARALALGANAAGVAGAFLTILLTHGTEALIATIRTWLDQLSSILAVLGSTSPGALTECDLLLDGDLETYCRLNGIDPRTYARRRRPSTKPSR